VVTDSETDVSRYVAAVTALNPERTLAMLATHQLDGYSHGTSGGSNERV
jgi:hypothetical protein